MEQKYGTKIFQKKNENFFSGDSGAKILFFGGLCTITKNLTPKKLLRKDRIQCKNLFLTLKGFTLICKQFYWKSLSDVEIAV